MLTDDPVYKGKELTTEITETTEGRKISRTVPRVTEIVSVL